MCEAVEKYANEKAKEAAKVAAREAEKNAAKRLFENGVSFEIVRSSITQLAQKELEWIYRKSAAL